MWLIEELIRPKKQIDLSQKTEKQCLTEITSNQMATKQINNHSRKEETSGERKCGKIFTQHYESKNCF